MTFTPGQFAFVMPTLNSELYLQESLDSLLADPSADTASLAIPIWVLDGGSTDSTPLLLASLQARHPRLHLRTMPGSHPAQRINEFIRDSDFNAVMICHSDDLYHPGKRLEALHQMREEGLALMGTQHAFFEAPIDAVRKPNATPYVGRHCTYPCSSDQLAVEIFCWWCISLNTVCLDCDFLRSHHIYYDFSTYAYSADYWMNWQLVQLGKAGNSSMITTLTRHYSQGDGPRHVADLRHEACHLRRQMLLESFPNLAASPELVEAFLAIDYRYNSLMNSRDLNHNILGCLRLELLSLAADSVVAGSLAELLSRLLADCGSGMDHAYKDSYPSSS
jgi:glycosyltransferase involved in cell wall biosynthesis